VEVFNARVPLASQNARAMAFALKSGKALLAGSDAHHPSEVGVAYAEFTQQPRCGSRLLQHAEEHLGAASPSLSQAQAFRPGLLTLQRGKELGKKELLSAPRRIGGKRSSPLVHFFSRYAALKRKIFCNGTTD